MPSATSKNSVQIPTYLVKPFLYLLPPPYLIPNYIRPVLIIRLGPPGIHTKVDSGATAKAFPPTIINLSVVELCLGNGFVAPIVAGGCQSGVSFAETFEAFVRVVTAGVDEEGGEVGEGVRETGGEEAAGCAGWEISFSSLLVVFVG